MPTFPFYIIVFSQNIRIFAVVKCIQQRFFKLNRNNCYEEKCHYLRRIVRGFSICKL